VKPWDHLKSATSLAVITLNLAFWIAIALPTSLLRLVVPPLAPTAHRALDAIYRAAVRVDDFWLRRVMGLRWTCPALDLDPRRSWLVVSNHCSWADIFLIQSLLVSHGLVVKFLTKRELLALPIVGLILWAFEFPLLRRTSRRGQSEEERKRLDFAALREACRSAREAPVALVCFAEGTRATAARRASAASPHRHLLPPRVGGFGALCDGLGDALAGVVDCTLVYGDGARTISFWEFLAGGSLRLGLEAERIAPGEIPAAREERARWLDARWAIKDERIALHLASRSREA
jgi:1-acyl-sn-glycerol-3-phosphate acyltransferase